MSFHLRPLSKPYTIIYEPKKAQETAYGIFLAVWCATRYVTSRAYAFWKPSTTPSTPHQREGGLKRQSETSLTWWPIHRQRSLTPGNPALRHHLINEIASP